MPDQYQFDPFAYRARLKRVVDGDTIDLTVDLGFHIRRDIRVRLKGVDTAEIYGVEHESDEYAEGIVHKHFVEDWFATAHTEHDGEWPMHVRTRKTGKYGRYIGVIVTADPIDGARKNLRLDLVDEFPDVVSE